MKLRVSAVQFYLRSVASFEEFAAQVEHYAKAAAEFGTEYLLYPEYFSTPLLSIPGADGKARPITALADFTPQFMALFTRLAREQNMHIIAGTHIVKTGDALQNVAHLFYPDGRVAAQPKIHITPTEVEEWHVAGGDGVEVFDTPKARIAMLTCYDIEFPEIVRMARAKGADVIFCPSCTDDLQGFYRVRYCCHARTIENQIYVVTTGTVGSLPTVDFMRMNTGQAAVLTPNDVPFPPRGILVEGELNHDQVVTADLDLDLLHDVRVRGSVMTWRDRRTDLYTDWKG